MRPGGTRTRSSPGQGRQPSPTGGHPPSPTWSSPPPEPPPHGPRTAAGRVRGKDSRGETVGPWGASARHLPWSLTHHHLRVSLRTIRGLSARVATPEGVRERSTEGCPCPVPPRSPETPPAFSGAVGPYLPSPIPAVSAEFAPEPVSPAVSRTRGFLPNSAGFGDNPGDVSGGLASPPDAPQGPGLRGLPFPPTLGFLVFWIPGLSELWPLLLLLGPSWEGSS